MKKFTYILDRKEYTNILINVYQTTVCMCMSMCMCKGAICRST